jgi:hypothetical protein
VPNDYTYTGTGATRRAWSADPGWPTPDDYRRARADRIAAALRGAWSSPERTLDQVRAEFKRRQNRTPEDDA